MAPGTSGSGQPQQMGGKKVNTKGINTSKRKAAAADDATQRRIGCPVLLESGCRIGEAVDPSNPGNAVKMICQNPKCEYSPFIHRRCYEEWEDLLVTVMATTSWSRSWTDAQRRSNLWDKKGYQLIGKMCRCLCDKGHVRRDLDYKPPVLEDPNVKKKLKKIPTNKNLPTLKNPDFKSGFIGKQLPNVNGSSATSATSTTPGTYIVCRSAAAKRQLYQSYATGTPPSVQNGYDYQRASCSATSVTSTVSAPDKSNSHHNNQSDDIATAQRHGSLCDFTRPHHPMPRVEGLQMPDDSCDGGENDLSDSIGEFENNIIPCVRSLLRWKNTPIQLNDSTLTDIVNSCSAETKKKISDDGGLGAALAKTGYFIVGADSLRLKENGTQLSDSLPAQIRDAIHGGDEIAKDTSSTGLLLGQTSAADQQKQEPDGNFISLDPPFGEDRFVTTNVLNQCTNPTVAATVMDASRFASIPTVTPTFPCGSSTDLVPAICEPVVSRSLSSSFADGSVESLKSAHEIESLCNEATNTQCFVPTQISSREVVENEYLQTEAPCEYFSRPLQFYNSSAPVSARFIPPPPTFPAGFIRQFLQPNPIPPPQMQQPMWYFREYQLFNGPSFEDLFRRVLPNVYNGTGRRFEATNVFNDWPILASAERA